MRLIPQEDEQDDNVEVTWDDQKRINQFSKLNIRLRAIEDQIGTIKQEKEALDDLSMELELADEDEQVMYKVGEAFIHMSQRRALKRLEGDQAEIDKQLAKLKERAEECESAMKELKVALYAKFGKAINLDE